MTTEAVHDPALDKLVDAVRTARPHLIDEWETTAVIESLGYTDVRIRREFGFSDTAALGVYVFNLMSARTAERIETRRPHEPHALLQLIDSVGASLVYALPWLVTFLLERVRPDALRLPAGAGPPLSLSLMLCLIVSGGFIQAIARRGQFYIGMKQPGLAALTCGYLMRLGALVSLGVAVAGLAVGWYFSLFTWPYLVLWADQFLILCALWLTCGVLTIRDEHWRVPVAFAVGGLAFLAVRATGHDALAAQLIGSAAVLAAAGIQVPRVFAHAGIEAPPTVVPPPRMTVLMYRALPFFWYGTLYFCFLFADRFAASASVAALTGAPFGMRPQYKLGMDLALLTFLFASAGVEFANVRFTGLVTRAMRQPFTAGGGEFARRLQRIHLTVLGLAFAVFVPTAALIGTAARRLLPGQSPIVWTMMAVGDVGYLLLAIGLVNGLALVSLNRPWSTVKALTAALAVNVMVGYVLSHMFSPYFAVAGLVAGGFVFAVQSSALAREAMRSGDHAISSPS